MNPESQAERNGSCQHHGAAADRDDAATHRTRFATVLLGPVHGTQPNLSIDADDAAPSELLPIGRFSSQLAARPRRCAKPKLT